MFLSTVIGKGEWSSLFDAGHEISRLKSTFIPSIIELKHQNIARTSATRSSAIEMKSKRTLFACSNVTENNFPSNITSSQTSAHDCHKSIINSHSRHYRRNVFLYFRFYRRVATHPLTTHSWWFDLETSFSSIVRSGRKAINRRVVSLPCFLTRIFNCPSLFPTFPLPFYQQSLCRRFSIGRHDGCVHCWTRPNTSDADANGESLAKRQQ